MDSSYLGEFSKEEIENMKRSTPFLDEELGIEIKYVAPLKKQNENDTIFQSIFFYYNDLKDNKKGEKGRHR